MEKALRDAVGHDVTDVSEHMAETQQLLAADEIFRQLVVQRSRAYARESQIARDGQGRLRSRAQTTAGRGYSIRKTYGRLLDMFEKAFKRRTRSSRLPMYYPLAWYQGADKSIDPLEENRQKQVVGLIRTQFLKRFESSVAAFELPATVC